ncbi:MAG: 1-(5-phosphoribosyl)-5-[(5-phosphoribosylamino)methylideneamino]imidazole-4-carboxamide isomerase [Elusimicrobiota bacterium]
MIVIPAIDLRNGKCVRLTQGKISNETVYSNNPLLVAKLWQAQGAKRIHIVDLDGAFSGEMKNQDIILKITKEIDVPVEVGGGIRDNETIEKLIENGIDKIILGTSAISDKELLKESLKKFGQKIIVGIDSSSGRVAVKGWKDVTSIWATSLVKEMEDIGVKEIIVTDIKKDGTMRGPNIRWIKKIASKVHIDVIVSGGISSIKDINRIKNLNLENIRGVIIGKALYRDNLTLPEAIKAGES